MCAGKKAKNMHLASSKLCDDKAGRLRVLTAPAGALFRPYVPEQQMAEDERVVDRILYQS